MTSDAEKDGAAYRRSILDEFTTSLQDDADLTPAARREATQLFEQALEDAVSQPKSASAVLADWDQTTTSWNDHLEAMQKRGDISATDAADISRQFAQIAQTLRTAQQHEADAAPATATTESPQTPLPQGMPAEVAAALGQPPRKP